MKNLIKIIYSTSLGLLLLGVVFYIVEMAVSTDKYTISIWGTAGIVSWVTAFILGFLFVALAIVKNK